MTSLKVKVGQVWRHCRGMEDETITHILPYGDNGLWEAFLSTDSAMIIPNEWEPLFSGNWTLVKDLPDEG